MAMKNLFRGGMNLLDIVLPEELIGLDITPGYGDAGGRKGGRKIHQVIVMNGAIKDASSGRILGYTSKAAKKKFKTKRRRKRWTQADEREWQYKLAIANVQAGKVGVAP